MLEKTFLFGAGVLTGGMAVFIYSAYAGPKIRESIIQNDLSLLNFQPSKIPEPISGFSSREGNGNPGILNDVNTPKVEYGVLDSGRFASQSEQKIQAPNATIDEEMLLLTKI